MRGSELVGLPVQIGVVRIGNIEDVICSRDLGHVLGLVVKPPSRGAAFVPWVAADVSADSVSLKSVYALLSTTELALYLDNGVRLSQRLRDGDGDGDLYVEREGGLTPRAPRVRAVRNEAA
jgi:hypothetical protein